jgi:hypothetical protein
MAQNVRLYMYTAGREGYKIDMSIVQIIGVILAGFMYGAFFSMLGILGIRYATLYLEKFFPSFKMAFKAAFVCWTFQYLIGFLIALITNGKIESTFHYLILLTEFLITSAMLSSIIKNPNTGPIRFRNASLINLAQILMVLTFTSFISLFSKNAVLNNF